MPRPCIGAKGFLKNVVPIIIDTVSSGKFQQGSTQHYALDTRTSDLTSAAKKRVINLLRKNVGGGGELVEKCLPEFLNKGIAKLEKRKIFSGATQFFRPPLLSDAARCG